MRKSSIKRKTRETEIDLYLNIDGEGKCDIDVKYKFFRHMLETLSFYSGFDIKLKASGDLRHHLIEDIGISLGNALNNALGEKRGIMRYGYSIIPMDESLVLTSLDISGRGFFSINYKPRNTFIEDVTDYDLIHFLQSFSLNARISLHIVCIRYKDLHHLFESIFKSLGLSLKIACKIINERVPSTKGML